MMTILEHVTAMMYSYNSKVCYIKQSFEEFVLHLIPELPVLGVKHHGIFFSSNIWICFLCTTTFLIFRRYSAEPWAGACATSDICSRSRCPHLIRQRRQMLTLLTLPFVKHRKERGKETENNPGNGFVRRVSETSVYIRCGAFPFQMSLWRFACKPEWGKWV